VSECSFDHVYPLPLGGTWLGVKCHCGRRTWGADKPRRAIPEIIEAQVIPAVPSPPAVPITPSLAAEPAGPNTLRGDRHD
jgi:hypothetical protein